MLDNTQPESAKILTDRRTVPHKPFAQLVEAAAREQKIGPGRIFREILGFSLRKKGLKPDEYFAYRVYRKDLDKAEKREFIGSKANFDLNCQLSPPGLTQMRGFLGDKFAFPALMSHLGLPTTQTQAIFVPNRFTGAVPALRDRDEIVTFLSEQARFPIFGKPIKGAQALGTVRIERVDAEAGQALLQDGRVVGLRALAEEIVVDFPDGYLFQSVVEQHPTLSDMVGDTVATLRLVTVIEEEDPRLLYALWKIPSPSAMSDNFWQDGSMLAWLNADTGMVERCITGKGSEQKEVDLHPGSGKPILGLRLPYWTEALDLVKNAHALFPVNGCLGWDVAIGANGPVIVECNENTGHDFYQMGTGRGVLNAEMQATFNRVMARNKRLVAGLRERAYKVER